MSNKNQKPIHNRLHDIVGMAWCDKTSFETIKEVYGISEGEVKRYMKAYLKPRSYVVWRQRVKSKPQKHRRYKQCP
ncbi:MAG: TIGR03643 family protein [Pseudomonadota bacterium]|nr:TIGR03643 family protein [Pseudomonadota bacterium]